LLPSPTGFKIAKIKQFLNSVNSLIDNPAERDEILNSLKSEGDRFVYDDFTGNYTWNAGTQKWDKTSSTQIIFNFPATKGGTTNNAVLTFVSYTDEAITIDMNTEYLPASASINLTVDGTKELEFTFSASYKTDGTPESIDAELYINPFTLTLSIKNTNTAISEDFKWSMGETNILAFGSSLEGNFTSITTVEDPGSIISEASAYIQIFDFRIEGALDVSGMAAYEEPTIAQINSNSTILLKWANDDVKIADGEFYVDTDDDLSVMLTFTDGSKADAEVFFDAMMDNFEDFFENLENDMS
jgi:hypothetical protein